MHKRTLLTIFALALLVRVPAAGAESGSDTELRALRYDLEWTVRAEGIDPGADRAVVWISVPQQLREQDRLSLAVDTGYDWSLVREPLFGNELVRVEVPNPDPAISIGLSASVVRRPVDAPIAAPLDETARSLYLREESLVTLSDRVRALADSVGGDHRTRYDYVLGLMDYDKSVPGYGAGDTERACDVRKGNCTDFHSLFLSLSRARGVPALFEMGVSTKPEGAQGVVGGYHCWAWFFEDGTRIPVDISEADKHPSKAEFFYGNLDADRITFSRGREVEVPGMAGPALNYVPSGGYVEVDDSPFDNVTRTLSYRVEAVEDENDRMSYR